MEFMLMVVLVLVVAAALIFCAYVTDRVTPEVVITMASSLSPPSVGGEEIKGSGEEADGSGEEADGSGEEIKVGSLWCWPEPDKYITIGYGYLKRSPAWTEWARGFEFVEVLRIDEFSGAVVFLGASSDYIYFDYAGGEITWSPYSPEEQYMLPDEFLNRYVPVV